MNASIAKEGLIKKLGDLDSRLITNWLLKDVKVEDMGGNLYVKLTCENLNEIIFFDDLKEVEKAIKKKIRGAYNFALMRSTARKPKFSFCI